MFVVAAIVWFAVFAGVIVVLLLLLLLCLCLTMVFGVVIEVVIGVVGVVIEVVVIGVVGVGIVGIGVGISGLVVAVHSSVAFGVQCSVDFNCDNVGDWVVGPYVHCVVVGGGVVM